MKKPYLSNTVDMSNTADMPRRQSARFNPYLLFRRGMLPFSSLASLAPADAWALLDQSERESAQRRALADSLADRLYQLIPTLDPSDKQSRRLILQARRDLHNDRPPADAAVEALERVMGDADRALFEEWKQSRLSDEGLQAAAGERLAAELQDARRHLADLATNEYFLKGIQLSGAQLLEDIRHYSAHIRRPMGRPWTKKLRQTENTIIRYAYRMALRTSPFGAFTEIGAQPWAPVEASEKETANGRRPLVRLSRSLLVWMASELRRIEGSERILFLRLNNTLRPMGDCLEAFNRGMEGQKHSYWGEGFVSVRNIKPVAVIIDALAGGPLTKMEVIERLVSLGMSVDRALIFIDRLIQAGVCHEGLGLPDQTTSYGAEVAARLRGAALPQAAACAERFEALERIESEFGEASAERRERLLDEISGAVRHFSEICGLEAPLDVSRTLIFEDLAANRPAHSWNPDIIERNKRRFSRLLRLLPIFHHSTMEKLGVYSWFISRFGENGCCVDLLELYRLFSEHSQAEISAVLQGKNNPDTEHIRTLQHDLLRRLSQAARDIGDAPTLRLDGKCLDDLAASLPNYLPAWQEVSLRLQIAPAHLEGSPLVVINDVTTGHGVFFSRFCDLVEHAGPEGWSLRRAVSDTIARNNPDQADLTAVFGHNVNLHPRLTPKEVVYPGSVARGTEGVLTLRDIVVRADPVARALRLFDRRDGRPIQLTPMNFLFPAAAPMLYRFLCVFSPLCAYRVGLWNRLREMVRPRPKFLPRLVFGDLVLERRRWYAPASEIREMGDGSLSETTASLSGAEKWRQARNLPRECFFRLEEPIEDAGNIDNGRNWIDETRRWALSARNARRKRQYLDFRNPFLTRLLLKQVDAVAAGEVLFQECLPPTAGFAGNGALESAEEFLVEMRLGPDDQDDRGTHEVV